MKSKKQRTVAEAWQVIDDWFDRHCSSLREKLHGPASEEALSKLEKTVGLKLPDDFKASYLIHNGSERDVGPLVGNAMLSVEGIAKEWKELKKVAKVWEELLPIQVSHEKGMIKEDAVNPRWIPFVGPDEDNFIGLDFDPGPKGTGGQIINFGADQFTHGSERLVLAPSFRGFMNFLADLFAEGKVEMVPDGEEWLQLKQRRKDGATCNLFTGLYMLFGIDTSGA